MVQLSKEAIEKFKKLIKQEYGVEYTDQQALESGTKLVNLFATLLKWDRKQNPNLYKKK